MQLAQRLAGLELSAIPVWVLDVDRLRVSWVNEAGLAQCGEVLGHRLPGDRQLGGELRRRRCSSARQCLDDVTPVRVRERGEERS